MTGLCQIGRSIQHGPAALTSDTVFGNTDGRPTNLDSMNATDPTSQLIAYFVTVVRLFIPVQVLSNQLYLPFLSKYACISCTYIVQHRGSPTSAQFHISLSVPCLATQFACLAIELYAWLHPSTGTSVSATPP